MEIKVFKGKIKALGASAALPPSKLVTATQVSVSTYSFVKMADGQLIRRLMIDSGLGGKLHEAAIAGDDVDLHVTLHPEGTSGLIAIKTGDGCIYATNIAEGSKAARRLIKARWIFGVLLIPLLGVGLILLWRAWQSGKVLARLDEGRQYIASLPQAIII